MSTTTETELHTVVDLLTSLGDISPSRVRLRPSPGTATEADLIAVNRGETRNCELVDGVLVEKVMSYRESLLAVALSALCGSSPVSSASPTSPTSPGTASPAVAFPRR